MITVVILLSAFVLLGIFMLQEAYRGRLDDEERRGWRVRCLSGGKWAYEEKITGEWLGFPLEELGDHREPPHIIDVRDAARWSEVPVWAVHRRSEIISRIASELPSPQYQLKEASESDLAPLAVALLAAKPRRVIEERPVI